MKKCKWLFLNAKQHKKGHVSVTFVCKNYGCNARMSTIVNPKEHFKDDYCDAKTEVVR